jgi:hypothetical protein
MTLQQRIDRHDKEIAEIRALQVKSEQNLARLEKSMIKLVNQQAETKRSLMELSRTINRFIASLQTGNGHHKR